MERGGGGGGGSGDDPLSWRGKQKRSSMDEETEEEEEETESPAASSPDPFVPAIRESIGIRDEGPGCYPWAGLSSDFSYEREARLEMRDRDPEATYRADVRRNDEALQQRQKKLQAAEYSRLLRQEYEQQSLEYMLGGPCSQSNQQQQSAFRLGSWPGEQQHLQYVVHGPELQPDE